MIGPTDVQARIEEMLETAYPTRVVYTDTLPIGFTRPSSLIGLIARTQTDIAKGLQAIRLDFTIVLFVAIDDYSNPKQTDLWTFQAEVLALFSQGYITVGDRAPRVSASNGGSNLNEAYVDLTVEYNEDARADTTTYQNMGAVNLTTSLQED